MRDAERKRSFANKLGWAEACNYRYMYVSARLCCLTKAPLSLCPGGP